MVRSSMHFVAHALAVLMVISGLLAGPASSPAAAAAGDPFRFIYDQNGRLVASVTPTDSARWTYDAVGNITAITRVVATTLSVLEFAPHTGPVGASVRIYGTAFSTTPASNIVKFNGVTATVSSSTTTEIVTTVPAGATTGTISVKVGTPTATSAASFTVQGAIGPTISSFSPAIAAPGVAMTITGTNFDTNVLFDKTVVGGTYAKVTSATATSIGAQTPPVRTSGKVTVSTPNGTATSAADFFAVPTGFVATDIGPTGRLTYGTASPFTWSVAGSVGLFVIDGNAGDRLSLTLSGSISQGYYISITNPDGTTLVGSSCCGTTFVDATVLPMTGTYTIAIDAAGVGTGSLTLTPYNVPADPTSAITPGGAAVQLTSTTPGQNFAFTFSGTAGQRISLTVAKTGLAYGYWLTVKNPDGTTLVPTSCCGTIWVDTTVLTQTGTHTIVVDPADVGTGSVTITLYSVPADATNSITPGGSPVTLSTTTPGQNIAFTFSGTIGQRVSLSLAHTGLPYGYWLTIKNPDGSVLVGTNCCGATWVDTTTLTQTGTHTIFVDPADIGTGSATATLYDVPADATVALSAGVASQLTISVPGQNFAFTFSGTTGQRVSATLDHTGLPHGYWFTVKNPDGSTLVGTSCCGTTWLDATTLTQTGSHTIYVDAVEADTGTATATFWVVPADATTALVVDGPSQTLTVTTPAQNAIFTFDGTAAEHMTFSLTAAYAWGWWLTVKNPDGSILWGTGCCGNTSASFTLTQTGTHTILVDPVIQATGDATGSIVHSAGAAPSEATVASARTDGGLGDAGRKLASVQAEGPAPLHLVGQIFNVERHPLAGVLVTFEGVHARTDEFGRFDLAGVPSGQYELIVDARDLRSGNFGTYEIGVAVREVGTTEVPFTIWLSRIDDAHRVHIDSPTIGEVVLTSPTIPGLEVHLAPGTVITDTDGNVVTEVSLTELSRSLTPFPLPSLVETPLYFTVQPGGAYLSKKARIYYPNRGNALPGARAQFWHYSPARGWYVYGSGQVAPDGKHVVPDPGVGVYELTGAMIHFPNLPLASLWPAIADFFTGGDPVDLGTGLFVLDKTDLTVADVLPLSVTRTYRTQDSTSRYFGIGATNSMELFIRLITAWQQIDLVLPDGARVQYLRTSPGNDQYGLFEHTSTPSRFYKSSLRWNGATWDLVLKDGTKYTFNSDSTLASVTDRFANRVSFVRNGGGISPHMDIVRSPNGRWLQFTYDGSDRISSVSDNVGRSVSYTYDASGRLWKVTDPAGKVTEYGYDTSHRMTTIKDPLLITYLTNEYDSTSGRVTKQTQADTTFFQFAYTVANGQVTQTDVTDPRGFVRRVTFNSAGYGISETAGFGAPEAQTSSYARDPATQRVLSVTDALGRVTQNTYDASGNVSATTNLYGTPNAVTTTFTYDPTWNELASITDPLTHLVTFHYDARGSRDSETDSLGHASTFEYNLAGELTKIWDPLQKLTVLAYQKGDLASVTDPLGRTTTRFSDAAGRPVDVTDALGNRTRTVYDNLNRVLQVIDPLGNATVFTYDDNGNRLTVKDAKLNVTTYTYDNLDRVATRRDALLRTDTYTYDASSNLLTVTDRKAQITEFRYDTINRQTFAGYGRTGTAPNFVYANTINYTYDAGNRPRTGNDSAAGTISRDYDDLDRLTLETNAQGTIGYQYDAAGRRSQLTVSGQPPVFYCYDNADRLLTIRSASCTGTSLVAFGYDNADRRTTLDLPNATHLVYGYDDASQLLSMTWSRSGTTVGDLAYTYDPSGRRTTMSGSYARLNLPLAVTSALYNVNNQLTKWGSTNITYDNNGNMLGDGTNTYTWNKRDQLQAVTKSGQTLPSFTYDAFGRRLTKTLGTTVTTYRYDGGNTVQELTGSNVTANILTGLGVDEVFQRSEGGTARSLISDALGTTLGLADSAGAIQTSYSYAPYGDTAVTGSAANNRTDFTGRENDSDGLYYYRARYYHPVFSRFISEDPIGFAGGDPNLYRYAADSPTNFGDPSGQIVPWLAACAVGAAFQVGIDLALNAMAGRKNGVRGALGSAASGCIGSIVGGASVAVLGRALGAAKGAGAVGTKLAALLKPQLLAYADGPLNPIIVTPARLAHVVAGHTPGGLQTAGNSIFNAGEDLLGLINLAGSALAAPTSAGRLARVVDAGRSIGVDRATGMQTSVFTVITTRANQLITMFPGIP